jgi:ketosteroid isomerase-like protein
MTVSPFVALTLIAVIVLLAQNASKASEPSAEAIVAKLDNEFQAAVGRNDADTMDRILADDMVLVLGDGRTFTKAEQLEEARSGKIIYEQQKEVDNSQKVRVWGNTAVVTAKLWIKGTRDGVPFDRTLWFSDTYIRTKDGWKYVFGQTSLPLPKEAK